MIRSFSCSETERFFATGKSRRLPPDILARAVNGDAFDVEIVDYH